MPPSEEEEAIKKMIVIGARPDAPRETFSITSPQASKIHFPALRCIQLKSPLNVFGAGEIQVSVLMCAH